MLNVLTLSEVLLKIHTCLYGLWFMKSLIEERINIENERHKLQEMKDLKMRTNYSKHLFGLVYYDVCNIL